MLIKKIWNYIIDMKKEFMLSLEKIYLLLRKEKKYMILLINN